VVIRPASPADGSRILDLVRLGLGEGSIPRSAEYWAWKHHLNPFGDSPMLIAEASGELVGLRVFMRWEWEHRGSIHRAVRAVDTATHPAWRGRGIFSHLTLALAERMRAEGASFVFNTPNALSRPGYLKMGWKVIGRADPWILPLRPLAILRSLTRRQTRVLDANPLPDPEDEGLPAAASLASLGGLPLFLRRIRARLAAEGLATPRTPEYLDWRYSAVPGFSYGSLAELDGDDGAVLIFRYREWKGLRELRLCELLHSGSVRSYRAASGLIRRLRRTATADYLSVMAPRTRAERGLLVRNGFLPAPRTGPVVTVRPLATAALDCDPLLYGSWRASIGDLELF